MKITNVHLKSILKTIVVFSVICCISLLCIACAKDEKVESNASLATTIETANNETQAVVQEDTTQSQESTLPAETTPATKTIETAYLTLTIPGEYAQDIEHREVTEGKVAMEIFSMMKGSDSWELFRIYFGDPAAGKNIGTLNVDGEKISVTLGISEYAEGTFPDAETAELYYQSMELFNHILEKIRSDERFVGKEDIVVEKEDEKVSHWTFSLPQNMEWEESVTDGGYSIAFYGLLNGEKYKLYSVAVSEDTLNTVLGNYMLDGVKLPVSVESYELPNTQNWSKDAELELFTMMESINDVIQVIMSSEGFSVEQSEM